MSHQAYDRDSHNQIDIRLLMYTQLSNGMIYSVS
jgi:hypothetical protein